MRLHAERESKPRREKKKRSHVSQCEQKKGEIGAGTYGPTPKGGRESSSRNTPENKGKIHFHQFELLIDLEEREKSRSYITKAIPQMEKNYTIPFSAGNTYL